MYLQILSLEVDPAHLGGAALVHHQLLRHLQASPLPRRATAGCGGAPWRSWRRWQRSCRHQGVLRRRMRVEVGGAAGGGGGGEGRCTKSPHSSPLPSSQLPSSLLTAARPLGPWGPGWRGRPPRSASHRRGGSTLGQGWEIIQHRIYTIKHH